MSRRLRLAARLAALLAALVAAAPALAYVRSEDPKTGACLWWGQRHITYWINQDGAGSVTDGSDIDAVKASFQTWSDVTCSDFTYEFGGLTNRSDVGYDGTSTHNLNLVVWRGARCTDVVDPSDACWNCADSGGLCCADKYHCWEHSPGIIGLTTTTYNVTTGQLYDADMELNSADYLFTTVDSPQCDDPNNPPACTADADCQTGFKCFHQQCLTLGCVRTDIQNTVTHEAGHVLGLGHTPVADATMYASAPEGETSKRSLATDDIQGVCDIYPIASPTTTCLGGTVTIAPASATDEVRGCGGCSGPGAATPLAFLLVLFALRPRRRAGRSPTPGT